jgi:hypothetical protein
MYLTKRERGAIRSARKKYRRLISRARKCDSVSKKLYGAARREIRAIDQLADRDWRRWRKHKGYSKRHSS